MQRSAPEIERKARGFEERFSVLHKRPAIAGAAPYMRSHVDDREDRGRARKAQDGGLKIASVFYFSTERNNALR